MSEGGIVLDECDEAGYPVLPTVGAQLRAAREAKGLALSEVAEALKLGVRQIEAVENGNWQILPGATFIRGFVRNYARMVQIDAAPLMEQLDSVLDSKRPELALPETVRATMPQPAGRPQRRDYAMVTVGLAFLLVAVLIYFFMPADLGKLRDSVQSLIASYSASPSATVPQTASSSEPVLPPGTSLGQVINPQSAQIAEPAAANSTPAAAAPVPAPAAEQPAPATANAASAQISTAPLQITFSKESWVEVRDRRGNVVLAQRGAAGSEKAVEGQPPFALIIGYAPGVSLKFRGSPVDLAPYTRGDVARLSLE